MGGTAVAIIICAIQAVVITLTLLMGIGFTNREKKRQLQTPPPDSCWTYYIKSSNLTRCCFI